MRQFADVMRFVAFGACARHSRRTLLIAAFASPVVLSLRSVHAQTKMRRIGLLSSHTAGETSAWHQAFRKGLAERGWVEGKNISIEYRYADGNSSRAPELAADLVRLHVDVIVASVTPDVFAAHQATKTIPIVMVAAGDPVALGLIKSLARPGGNVTGLAPMSTAVSGKRLELLAEAVPKVARIGVLRNPDNRGGDEQWAELQDPAKRLGVQLLPLEVRALAEVPKAFEDAARQRAGALFLLPDPVITPQMKRIAELAAKHRLPSIFHIAEFADAGGLMSYGSDRADMFRRAAIYVDKLLNGAKPADLPVEQPTTFELVVNMRTAKALGIVIPQTILIRANRVIE